MSQRTLYLRPIGILLLSLLSYLAAQGTGIRLFFHLFYLLLALLVLSYLWAWINVHGLRVERETFTHRSQVGDEARERITIRNMWSFPKLWVELRDHSDLPQHGTGFVTYLPGHERRRWSARTVCTMRGKFTLGPATLVSGDPFGIFRLDRPVAGTSEVLVYPRTTPLPGFSLPSAELPGGQDVKSRAFHVTPNVSTIRDYQPGDGFNRIHWRSTARTGQLMVKEFELDPTAEMYIVLDMQERVQQMLAPARKERGAQPLSEQRIAESTEEYGVLAAASIARQLLEQNRMLGLISWGQHREVIPAERESRQLFKILEALAVLRAHGAQPLAEVLAAESVRFGRNCTLVIITASLDERWIVSLQHLLYRGVRAVVVLVDPQSFGGWRDSLTIQGRLAELRVPTYVFAQGQSLADALRQPVAVSWLPSMAR
ncbi:MAG TPA: DUF58 domain-containing protein [Roseiflexaceae bacterium]|jgi:uncharacterized protein (DUF58 family)